MTSQITRHRHADGKRRPYIAAAVHGGVVYPCGQIPTDPEGVTPDALVDQVGVCFDNLERVLVSAGSSLGHLLQLTVYLADLTDFDRYNEAYLARMTGHSLPPRTTVQVAGFRGAKRIEISAIAAVAEAPDDGAS